RGVPHGAARRAREAGERAARLDQLLSAAGHLGLSHRLLLRPRRRGARLVAGRARLAQRMHGPGLLQRARGNRGRSALAQREVREQRRAGAVPHPHQGGVQVPGQALQRHREAGQGSLQQERLEERTMTRTIPRNALALFLAAAVGAGALAAAADNAGDKPAPAPKVLVVAKIREEVTRRSLETAARAELNERGVETILGSDVMTEADFESLDAVRRKVESLGVDGVI